MATVPALEKPPVVMAEIPAVGPRKGLRKYWHLYAATALSGKRVSYVSEPLNVHRRHENGLTSSLDETVHLVAPTGRGQHGRHDGAADVLVARRDRREIDRRPVEAEEVTGLTGHPAGDGPQVSRGAIRARRQQLRRRGR